jgi:hypothetical protein
MAQAAKHSKDNPSPQCTLGFQGYVDEVRIFNRALSADEIQGIYLSTP